jgi:hypothetical protein
MIMQGRKIVKSGEVGLVSEQMERGAAREFCELDTRMLAP